MFTIDSLDEFAADGRYDVAAHRMVRQGAEERHGHRFLEIVIVEEGSAVHVTEGGAHEVTCGDVFILNPSRTHAYRETRSFAIVNVLARESFMLQLQLEMGVMAGFQSLFNLGHFSSEKGGYAARMRLEEGELATTLGYVDEIERYCKSAAHDGPVFCHAWGRLLVAHLAALGSRSGSEGRFDALAQAIARVERSIVEPLSLADLVAQSGMSERSFLRKFKEATGRSPIQHQLLCRLRHACSLLANTDLNVTEIALSCGFQDSNYFSRQFSRAQGVSPRAWRRNLCSRDGGPLSERSLS